MCFQIHAGVKWTPDLGYPSQQTQRKMMQRTRRKIDAAPKAKIAPEALWGTGDGWPICLALSGSTGKQIGRRSASHSDFDAHPDNKFRYPDTTVLILPITFEPSNALRRQMIGEPFPRQLSRKVGWQKRASCTEKAE